MFMDLQEIVYTPGTLEMLMFLVENIIDIDSLTLILSRTAMLLRYFDLVNVVADFIK